MGGLKLQNLEYLENVTKRFNEIRKFLTCASLVHHKMCHILRNYRFVKEVTFNFRKMMYL